MSAIVKQFFDFFSPSIPPEKPTPEVLVSHMLLLYVAFICSILILIVFLVEPVSIPERITIFLILGIIILAILNNECPEFYPNIVYTLFIFMVYVGGWTLAGLAVLLLLIPDLSKDAVVEQQGNQTRKVPSDVVNGNEMDRSMKYYRTEMDKELFFRSFGTES